MFEKKKRKSLHELCMVYQDNTKRIVRKNWNVSTVDTAVEEKVRLYKDRQEKKAYTPLRKKKKSKHVSDETSSIIIHLKWRWMKFHPQHVYS